MRTSFAEGDDFRQSRQDCVNAAAQIANAFAMHDADLKNPARPALGKVRRDEFANILGPKRVQVEHAVDRQLLRFVPFVKHTAQLPQAR